VTARCRNHSARILLAALIAAILIAIPTVLLAGGGTENIDYDMVTRIREEGFRDSKVMDILEELTDRIGPRVTGSPNMKKANEWAREKLTQFGISNAHLESYGPFGRGWAEELTWVRMTSPDVATLVALPRAWTPSTPGPVKGEVVRVKIDKIEDLEQYRGKLAGKILLMGEPPDLKMHTDADGTRLSEQKLDEISEYGIPSDRIPGGFNREAMMKRMQLNNSLIEFFQDEKVAAVIEPSHYDGGMVTMYGGQHEKGKPVGVPTVNMAAEHWGRIYRLLEHNVPVEVELNVQTKFYDDDDKAYNTVAEIPGTDKKDEIVMIGGHLDSWHGGTGATDNGTGAAAAIEAMRILKALDVKPRRTIRIGLWSGEEQGLLGSRAYVSDHLAAFPEPTDPKEKEVPSFMRRRSGPLQFKPDYNKVSAYFNLDNGSGKLRGIYCQENAGACALFEQWIAPFKDLGLTMVTMRNTSGTDHLSFDAVAVPGFQFVQDPLEYFSRTHHTNMDVYERVQREDVMQQAVVLAWFAYEAAMRDQMIPRKSLPKPDMNMRDGMPVTVPRASAR
jgi:hypothetical protein